MKNNVGLLILFVQTMSLVLVAKTSESLVQLRSLKEKQDAAWLDLRSKHETAKNNLRKQRYAEWAAFDKDLYRKIENTSARKSTNQIFEDCTEKGLALIRKQKQDEQDLQNRLNNEIDSLNKREDNEIDVFESKYLRK